MAITRKNMAVYDKVLTEFFKKLLDWQPRARDLMGKVHSANSFEKILDIFTDDLKKHSPYGTPESSWMKLMRDTNDAWHQIKHENSDAVALVEIIALYKKIANAGCYDYIYNELKMQLFDHAKSLQLDDASRKVLDAFVLPANDENKATTAATGLFAKREVKHSVPAQPDSLQKLTGDVEDLKQRVVVVEQKVGITLKV